jgi:hypothetical protein
VTDVGGAATPTGSVEFFDGATDLGPGSALVGAGNSATSTLTISTLGLGSHSIEAVYTSTGAFLSGHGALTQTIDDATATAVGSNNNPATQGQPATFTATVTDVSVEFFDGTADLGPGSALVGNGNSAASQFTTAPLTAGVHSIHAVYTPSGMFLGGNGTLTQTVYGLGLSKTTVLEFRPAGTQVGVLSTTEPASPSPYTYALVSGAGSDDNAMFRISGNQLLTADSFNFAAKSSYSIRVRSTDQNNVSFDQVFTITVVDDPALTLSGGTFTIHETSANDAFFLAAGATTDSMTFNGMSLAVDSAAVDAIVYQGEGGNDSVTVVGGSGPRTLGLGPTHGQLTEAGLTFTFSGVANAYIGGGPGDVAYLYDSPGNDVFAGTPSYSSLSGPGFSEYAVGYGTVVGIASQGGNDTAYLGAPAGAVFVGTPTYSYLQGGGVTIEVAGFKAVTAYGAGGDAAYLGGGAGSNVFVGTPTYSYLQGGGVTNEAVGFQAVTAYAAPGSSDTAYLYGGAGSNLFVGTSAYSYLQGVGFSAEAVGFQGVTGIAAAGSANVAYLYAAPGNDSFYGYGASGVLVAGGDAYGVNGFGSVTIVAYPGGFDQAFVSSLFYVLAEDGAWH